MSDQRGFYHPDIPAPAPRSSHIFLLLAILLLATVPLIAVAEPSPPAVPARVTVTATDALYLRECPSLTCRTVGSTVLGETLEVTGEAVDGFLPVRSDDREGWAYQLFLTHEADRPLVRRGVPGCDRVALILNTGIGEEPSETILATLAESQVPVTVFAMGWWAEAYPNYLRRLDEQTRAVIGSHGDTQTFLTNAEDAQVAAEVRNSAARIEAVLGYPIARYYTAYASDTDARVESIIAAEEYLPVGWTVSAGDYNGDDTAEGVTDRVMEGVTDGAIIELHLDGPATEQSTAAALPGIIAELQARSYTLVTVPEIILPCLAAP